MLTTSSGKGRPGVATIAKSGAQLFGASKMDPRVQEPFAIIVVYFMNETRFCHRGRKICSLRIDLLEGSVVIFVRGGFVASKRYPHTVARRFGLEVWHCRHCISSWGLRNVNVYYSLSKPWSA